MEDPRWPPNAAPAEKLLYDAVRAALPDEVTVLNNVLLSVGRDHRLVEVEADLVIVDPAGAVTVVEVKGGTMAYEADRATWRRLENRKVVRDPVQQVKRARSTIRTHLKQSRFPMEQVALRWVVATPECVLDAPGEPILPPERLWDARGLADPGVALDRAVGRLVDGEEPLGRARADAIARALRGRDVEGRPSLAVPVRAHERRVHAYTASHRDVLERFVGNPRVVVRGAAGTGKTFLAVEVAARFASVGQRVLLTCWHRLLADDLRAQLTARLASVGSPAAEEVADRADGRVVVTDLAGLAGDPGPAEGIDPRQWYYEELPNLAHTGRTGGPFDLVVLDEAQDPSVWWLHALEGLLADEGRWYAFADRRQDLFGTRSPLAEFVEVDHELRENFRNTHQIAMFAGSFGDVEPDCLTGHGPPVRFVAVHQDRVVGRVPEIARKLCRDQGFDSAEVAAIWLYHNPAQGDPAALIEQHRSGRMITTNSASFKGMERPVVVLGLDVRPDRTKAEHHRSVYVAASRARSHLVVVGDPDQLRREGLYGLAGWFKDASADDGDPEEDEEEPRVLRRTRARRGGR